MMVDASAAGEVDTDDTRALRADMVTRLEDSGAVVDEGWRRAFLAVPRHVLVPEFYDADALVVGEADEPGWLRKVYSDATLVTQRRDGRPTSSGTMPSLLADMLHALEVGDGDRVLQVATGTGYTAALLCERVGSANVISIEVDRDLTEAARDRLRRCGYFPGLVTGDGNLGYPAGAPYDRCIVTFGVDRVPSAWVEQTRLGGVIVAPVRTGLAKLTVIGAGVARGLFVGAGYFIRHREPSPVPRPVGVAKEPQWPGRTTDLPSSIYYDNDFRFVLAFTKPGLAHGFRNGVPHDLTLFAPDGSGAHITPDGQLTQTGPHRIWDDIEEIHKAWRALGSPPRERFGLTITPTEQYVWLDHPDSGYGWLV